jgi:hypothetical protein
VLCWFSSLWAVDLRCVRSVVGFLHVPQCHQRLQQLPHVGPAGAVEILSDLFDGEEGVGVDRSEFLSCLRTTLRGFNLAVPKI